MSVLETAYVMALGVSVLIAILMGIHTLKYWSRSQVRWFTGLLAGISLWAGAQIFQTLLPEYGASLFWSKVIYVGVVTLVFFLILYVLEYTDHEHLVTDRTIAVLALEPIAVVGVIFTNEVHGLFWTEVVADPSAMSGLAFSLGPLLWVHTVYSYFLILGATALLVRTFIRSQELYRHQIVALIVATLVPLSANALFFAGVLSFDLTSAGFLVTASALWISMYRFDFIDLSPVARNTVVDNMREGMFVLNEEDRFIDINETGRRMLGMEEDEEVLGEHAEDALSDIPAVYERYRDVMRGSDEFSMSVGDTVRHYRVDVSPLSNKREETVGRLFMVRDVTEQRKRQNELERQNEQLEQFASLVSHDLRNPLNVAEGYVGMIEQIGDEDVTEYAKEVDRSHERMRRIIEDVLTMARQGQTIDEREHVDLAALAREAWGNVDTREAILEIELDVTVSGDRGRLLQVLENLFRNALDHGPDDVTVRVGRLGDGGTGVIDPEKQGFYVEDDGHGIPPERRDEVLEAGHTTSEDGTGLGLSIVEQFVEAHGWEITVTEGSDGGACFEVVGATPVGAERPAPTPEAAD
jgi:PAS domain S-box-containing protein